VLATLFVIGWRFPRAPGPLIAMIVAGGCAALFGLAGIGTETVDAVPRGGANPPSLTGFDMVSLLPPAFGIALVAPLGQHRDCASIQRATARAGRQ
jgi:sulfate permease, SulP family